MAHIDVRPDDDIEDAEKVHQHDPEDHTDSCRVAVANMPYQRWEVEDQDKRSQYGENYSLRYDVVFDNQVVLLLCSHCCRFV
jgi:hypothetical protein